MPNITFNINGQLVTAVPKAADCFYQISDFTVAIGILCNGYLFCYKAKYFGYKAKYFAFGKYHVCALEFTNRTMLFLNPLINFRLLTLQQSIACLRQSAGYHPAYNYTIYKQH